MAETKEGLIVDDSLIGVPTLGETPPAPAGFIKFFPREENAVTYLRKECVDMIVAIPADLPIIGLKNENPKLRIMVHGTVAGERLSTVVEDTLENVLEGFPTV
jgi:hypothetical protein